MSADILQTSRMILPANENASAMALRSGLPVPVGLEVFRDPGFLDGSLDIFDLLARTHANRPD